MVSLTMMARLLEAVRPQTRLLLVGDPDQLASVEAGAVLADLVDGLGPDRVAALSTSHRFGAQIGTLADAVRAFADGRLARYKIPRYVHVTDAFPMTVTGKIQKFRLVREIMARNGAEDHGSEKYRTPS